MKLSLQLLALNSCKMVPMRGKKKPTDSVQSFGVSETFFDWRGTLIQVWVIYNRIVPVSYSPYEVYSVTSILQSK